MNTNLAYQDERPSELINGQLVMMSPSPFANHFFVAGNIYSVFQHYLRGKQCTPFHDGFELFLSEKDHFRPDMMIICDPDKIKPDGVYGAPDLVLEVLSPSTARRDRIYKQHAYEKAGVREYWLVDTNNKSIEQYLLQDGRFILHDVYTLYPDEVLAKMTEEECAELVTEFKCSLYDDLVIKLADVFERVR